jgi:hypothetical protein
MKTNRKMERYWRAYEHYRKIRNMRFSHHPNWLEAHQKMMWFHDQFLKEFHYGKKK